MAKSAVVPLEESGILLWTLSHFMRVTTAGNFKMPRRNARLSVQTVLAGAVLLSLCPFRAPEARESPEVYFYPLYSWGVESEDGSACSVRNEFNNRFILQFKGSGKRVEMLSVNFRQNVFEVGKTYDVVLGVPGENNRVLPASATQRSTLDIALSGHEEIYESIAKASVLDLKIQDNAFRFYLTGFAKAAKNFEKCIAGEVFEPTPYAESPAPGFQQQAYALPAVQEEALTPELQGAPAGAISFEDMTNTDLEKNESIAYEEAESLSVPGTNAIPGDWLDGRGEDFVSDGAATAAVNESNQGRQDARPPPGDGLEMPPYMDDEDLPIPSLAADETPGEEEDLISWISDNSDSSDNSGLRDDTNNNTGEDNSPSGPGSQVVSVNHKTPPMKVNREVIKAEMDLTSVGLNTVEPASAPDEQSSGPGYDGSSASRIAQLEETIRALRMENSALEKELQDALKEAEHERLSISSENWNLERATMRFNEAERQIKRLGRQLQKERAQCQMEKKDLEAMLFDPRVTDQAQLGHLSALEEKLLKTEQEMERQRVHYEERIRVLQQQSN